MSTSDKYESMNLHFQNIVPKSHINLTDMMDFYKKYISGEDKKKQLNTINEKYWKEIFSQKALKCSICNQKFN